MAALLCVREDRQRADLLAAILRARGFELDTSASAFERPGDYEASIALFSPAAVKSSLLLWAAKQAQDTRRLVPIFVSLTALPRAFSLTAIHDLTEWSGEEDHAGVVAVQRHLLRLQRARNDQESLAQLGRGKAAETAPLPVPAQPAPVVAVPAAPPVRSAPAAAPESFVDRLPVAPARQPEPAMAESATAPATPRRMDRLAQRPMMAVPVPRSGAHLGANRAGAAPALRMEPEPALEPAAAAPIVSAAARRRRLILRERMLSGLPLD